MNLSEKCPLDSGALPLFACSRSGTCGSRTHAQQILRSPGPPLCQEPDALSLCFVGFWVPASTCPMRCWVPVFLCGSLFLELPPLISRITIWMAVSLVGTCPWRVFLRLTNLQAPDLPIPPASWDKPAHREVQFLIYRQCDPGYSDQSRKRPSRRKKGPIAGRFPTWLTSHPTNRLIG